MNLKEAFRYQNKLSAVIGTAQNHLNNFSYVTKIKETHLRSQVMSDVADETQYIQNADELHLPPVNVMIDFLLEALHYKEQLSQAIYIAKSHQDFDLDGATALNTQRQEIARTLRSLSSLHASEELLRGEGSGYRFNQEGNQVIYRCDLRRVTTIDYDRIKVRKAAAQIDQIADDISAQIDRYLIETIVDFQPPFDVNASFTEIIEDYAATR